MRREDLLAAAHAAVTEVVPERATELRSRLDLESEGAFSPDHATLAEVTLVKAIEAVLREQLGEHAELAIARFAAQRARAAAYSAFLPRSSGSFERTEGAGSSDVPLGEPCPACQQTGSVHYRGSDVLEGALDLYYVLHTEVRDRFACTACQYTWTEHRHM